MSARKGQPSRKCAVCGHADQVRIELLLAGGAGQKAVGTKFGISKDSIHRHWHGHVTMERRAMLVMGPVPRQALAAQIAEENTSVLDNLRIVRAGLYKQYDAALEAGDRTVGALLAGKLHQNLQITAKITGELASSPLVSITNNQNNVSMLVESPEFSAFQARLIGALRNFPEARAAVIKEFERIEHLAPDDVPQLTGEVYEQEQSTAAA
ncbi:MAG: hypothetical protein ACLPV2_04795 [Steroidobacteraceae bacterium]